MVYACCKDQLKADGTSTRLMSFAPGPNSDRNLTLAVRAGRILQRIWIGGREAIINKVEIDRRHGMTDDLFFLIVMSRWAIARACLSIIDNDRLGKILQTAAIEIYRSSARFGPLDPDEEYGVISKLDQGLGFSDKQTNELVKNCRRFAANVASGTNSGWAETAS
jgi:hypothetical protein